MNIVEGQIDFDHFMQMDMRVGKIVKVEEFVKARKPAYKLWIDIGEAGIKQSSAQITTHYKADDLVGRLVACVVNFPSKQIADFKSEVLVLGSAAGDNGVLLLKPDDGSQPGSRIF